MQFSLLQFINVDNFRKLIIEDGSGDCGDNDDDKYIIIYCML